MKYSKEFLEEVLRKNGTVEFKNNSKYANKYFNTMCVFELNGYYYNTESSTEYKSIVPACNFALKRGFELVGNF